MPLISRTTPRPHTKTTKPQKKPKNKKGPPPVPTPHTIFTHDFFSLSSSTSLSPHPPNRNMYRSLDCNRDQYMYYSSVQRIYLMNARSRNPFPRYALFDGRRYLVIGRRADRLDCFAFFCSSTTKGIMDRWHIDSTTVFSGSCQISSYYVPRYLPLQGNSNGS